MTTSLFPSTCVRMTSVWQWFAVVVIFGSLSTAVLSTATAQEPLDPKPSEDQGPLTVENLIGSAVSLANRDYPEIEKAIQRFKNSDAQGALDYLNRAKDKYSTLPPTDVTFAKMQLAVRNANAVRILLERAVVEHPEDPEAFLMLADQAFVGGRTAEALALFQAAEPLVENFSENEMRKKNFEIRVVAGMSAVAERRQQWEQAQEFLKQWLELDPESAAAHQRMGVVLFHLEQSREALNMFKQARKFKSDLSHPFVIMARLFAQREDSVNAKKSFEKAYSEDQSDAQVAQAYAEWLIQEDELDQAQRVAATLREQSPDSVTALLLDGIVAQMQGDRDRAEQALTRLLSLDPSNAAATNILALLLIESDDNADRERALRYAQVNAERFEQSVQANITLGWVLYKLNRKTEAQTALQKGAQSGNLPANSTYLVAKIMSEQDSQKDKAILALEKVLQANRGMFLFRREAQELLDQLRAEAN